MLTLRTIATSLLTLSFAACMEAPQQPTESTESATPASHELTDAERPITSHKDTNPVANLGAPGEIAFGTINTTGAKLGGTTNWTSVLNVGASRFEVTITGESYFFSSYATMVTPMNSPGTGCDTNSVSGKLLISCKDTSGAVIFPLLAFVTFKP